MIFEDLKAWQESRKLVKMIYQLTSQSRINKDFGFIDQQRRASVSIMTNLAEGFDRKFIKEKSVFYNYSKASAGELRSLLYIVEDVYPEYISEVKECRTQLELTSKLISGLQKSTYERLESKNKKK